MDIISGEKQNDQAQKEQSRQGIISHGINSINNLKGANRLLSSPIKKAGMRLALQAGRSFMAFLAANPGVWAPILIVVFLFVFTLIIILGFAGAVPMETSSQTPTPGPAAP